MSATTNGSDLSTANNSPDGIISYSEEKCFEKVVSHKDFRLATRSKGIQKQTKSVKKSLAKKELRSNECQM